MLTKNAFKLSTSALCYSVLGIGLMLISSGCASMLQNNAVTPAEPPTAESSGNYYVEMHPAFGKPTIFKGELNGAVTVQTALEQSGATKKFRGMNVGLFRIVKENGRGLKLPVEYKYRDRQVAQHQNYALHPEDRIVVAKKSHSPLDQVIDSLTRD